MMVIVPAQWQNQNLIKMFLIWDTSSTRAPSLCSLPTTLPVILPYVHWIYLGALDSVLSSWSLSRNSEAQLGFAIRALLTLFWGLTLNYAHMVKNSPYKASHAIYVRKDASPATPQRNEIPEVSRRRRHWRRTLSNILHVPECRATRQMCLANSAPICQTQSCSELSWESVKGWKQSWGKASRPCHTC